MSGSLRPLALATAVVLAPLALAVPARASGPRLARIAQFQAPNSDLQPIFGTPVETDGDRFVIWQPTARTLATYDVETGVRRTIVLPNPRCGLRSASAGRAALQCYSPDATSMTGGYVMLLDLTSGASTPVHVAPNPYGFTGEDLLGERVGRHWIQGGHGESLDTIHTTDTRFYIDTTTGRVVKGASLPYEDPPVDDRIRDLDTPGLRMLTCGPSWGVVHATARPYFTRLAPDLSSSFWIETCRHGTLVRQIRLHPPFHDGTALNASVTVAYDSDGFSPIVAYRTRDGARLASWTVPGCSDLFVYCFAAVAGTHAVVWRSTLGETTIYVSRLDVDGPPTRHTRLVIRPGRGIGAITLGLPRYLGSDGEDDDDVAAFLGPGRRIHDGWAYRSGVARLTARYGARGAKRVSTAWPGTTVHGHRIGLGLRRLARFLPGWRHPACHGRLLAHGHNPTTVLTRTGTGQVRATVQAIRPPPCARRR